MVFSSEKNSNEPHRKFLLVVDSDPSSASRLKTLLKQFRYKVWSVGTGAEAFELCDIVMPALLFVREAGDLALIDFIKTFKLRVGTARTAVLAIRNGKDDAFDERAVLSAGAVTCLKVPLHVENLYRTIQVAIEPVPRMNLRINTKLPVAINDQVMNGSEVTFATALSESGLYLLTRDLWPVNTMIPLKLRVAGTTINADAKVIYAHPRGSHENFRPGMGMQFVRISDKDQERIRLFIRDEVRKGILTAP